MTKRIAISTGGGDAPGLNAVIRAVTKMAISEYGWEVIGIRDGFDGLIKPDLIMPLGLDEIRGGLGHAGEAQEERRGFACGGSRSSCAECDIK